MLVNSPSLAEMLMWERSKDVLRKAEREGLGRKASSAGSGLLNRTLASAGSLLISAGGKLQARYTPVQARLTSAPSPTSQ